MDQFTQQNAAMVEQTTATSHGLKHDIEQLEKSMFSFKVGRDDALVTAVESVSPMRSHERSKVRSPVIPSNRKSAAVPKEQPEPSHEGWEEF
jgi:methyl-accepting chemotaxis protein